MITLVSLWQGGGSEASGDKLMKSARRSIQCPLPEFVRVPVWRGDRTPLHALVHRLMPAVEFANVSKNLADPA